MTDIVASDREKCREVVQLSSPVERLNQQKPIVWLHFIAGGVVDLT